MKVGGDEWPKAGRVAEGHEGVGRGCTLPTGVGVYGGGRAPSSENFANFCLKTVRFGAF